MDIIVLITILLIIGWLIFLTFRFFNLLNHYQNLVKKTNRENLKDILETLLSNLKIEHDEIEKIKLQINKLQYQVIHHVQKVGVLRFNPFADTGGDQSFVLAILDGTDSGIVLTSLHSRGITRWYAKNVRNGQGVDHELSQEELKAIKKSEILEKIKRSV